MTVQGDLGPGRRRAGRARVGEAGSEAAPGPGPVGHVCWVVDDGRAYADQARAMLAGARRRGSKPMLFGPGGSDPPAGLSALAAVTADPAAAFLGGGALDPGAVSAAFRHHDRRARDEGYDGVYVVADMDWLVGVHAGHDAAVAFEAGLDGTLVELGATVVCAYRTSTFHDALVAGVLTVHPSDRGAPHEPPFRFTGAPGGRWRLAGELDHAGAPHLQAALGALPPGSSAEVDVSGLRFVDVAGLRAMVAGARRQRATLVLRGASPLVDKCWRASGFAAATPAVTVLA